MCQWSLVLPSDDHADIQTTHNNPYQPTICHLSGTGQYELVHACMGHPGERTSSILHLHVEGQEKLQKPSLYKCHICMLVKSTKRPIPTQHSKLSHAIINNTESGIALQPTMPDFPGSHFHMDMGFVRGTGYHQKTEDGRLVTSLDGYNSYLLIVDRATRYLWVFLSKNKTPPITVITSIFENSWICRIPTMLHPDR